MLLYHTINSKHPRGKVEIAELEAMRRNLWKGAQDTDEREGATSSAQSPPKRSRLPPGPFAGGMLTDNDAAGDQAGRDARGSVSGGNIQEPVWGEAARDVDEERYTADGLRLASPRRRGTTVPPTPPAASLEPAQEDGGDRAAHLPDDAFVASAFGVPGKEGEDFGREQDFGVVEGQVTGMAPLPEEVTPSGGYPKRLAGIMSFCRVSDKETCEILVAMGRVTVNGVVAQDPGMKVDILTDIIVANGERVIVYVVVYVPCRFRFGCVSFCFLSLVTSRVVLAPVKSARKLMEGVANLASSSITTRTGVFDCLFPHDAA